METRQTHVHKRPSRFGDIHRRAKHVGRVIAFLTREQLDFIDKISKDAMFSTGKKLSRSHVIQAIVEMIRKLDVSGKDVHSTEELEDKMNEAAKKALPGLVEELKRLKKGAEHETD